MLLQHSKKKKKLKLPKYSSVVWIFYLVTNIYVDLNFVLYFVIGCYNEHELEEKIEGTFMKLLNNVFLGNTSLSYRVYLDS